MPVPFLFPVWKCQSLTGLPRVFGLQEIPTGVINNGHNPAVPFCTRPTAQWDASTQDHPFSLHVLLHGSPQVEVFDMPMRVRACVCMCV